MRVQKLILTVSTTALLTFAAPLMAATVTVSGSNQGISTDPNDTPAINFLSDHTATIDDDVDITGDITTSANNQGILTFSGTTTVDGQVGTSAHKLKTINAGGLDNEIVNFTSEVYVNNLNITGPGSVSLMDNLTGNTHLQDDDALLEINDGVVVTGNVDSTGTGFGGSAQGDIIMSGDGMIDGNIGGGMTNVVRKLIITGGSSTETAVTGSSYVNQVQMGAGHMTFEGDLISSSVAFTADGTIKMDYGSELHAPVTTYQNDRGTLTFSNDTATTQEVNGQIGTTTHRLKAVNAGDATTTTAFNDEVFATNLNVTGAGTLNFNDDANGDLNFLADGKVNLADGSILTGDVANTGSNSGTLNFVGDGMVDGAIYGASSPTQHMRAITLSGNSKTVSVGDYYAANLNTLGNNTLNVDGVFELSAGQTLRTSITGQNNFGHVVATGAATVASGAKLDIDVATTAPISGYTYKIVDGASGTGVATLANGNLTDNSATLNFVQVANSQDLVVQAVSNYTSSTANNQGVNSVLNSAAVTSTNDPILKQVLANYGSATTTEEAERILSSVVPTMDRGASAASTDVSNTVQNFSETRMASLRSTSGERGMAAGAPASTSGSTWLQAYGQTADQDMRGGIAGYESDSYGMVAGVDSSKILDNGTVGLAVNYGQTNVDSDNANRTATDIDSYGVSLYAAQNFADNYFLNGQLGYGYNAIDSNRYNVGGTTATANADFSSNQYSAKLAAGRDFMTSSSNRGLVLTPIASVSYAYLDTDDYTETGAGGANLKVQNEEMSILDLGARLLASWKLPAFKDGSVLKPTLHAGYTYDAIGDNMQATSNFTGGGASFATQGFEPARSRGNMGASMLLSTVGGLDLMASYDHEIKEDYSADSGYIRGAFKF